MIGWRRAASAAAVALAVAPGCGNGGRNACEKSSECSADSECKDRICVPYAVCRPDLAATFASIEAGVFHTSCGTSGGNCHSSAGSIESGGLDLQSDAYAALLGPTGTGAPANNIEGMVRGLLRVVPGDPDNSFLVRKLETTSSFDPDYGSGMPRTAPGSVCPPTLAAIRMWIATGAVQ